MLFNKRKFDIRCYILMTSVNGRIKAYWFKDGYVRTSSKEYSLRNLENRLIHLTNDAIQKKSEEYGKFEYGNKVMSESYRRSAWRTFRGTSLSRTSKSISMPRFFLGCA
jgi:hypothetical protein